MEKFLKSKKKNLRICYGYAIVAQTQNQWQFVENVMKIG